MGGGKKKSKTSIPAGDSPSSISNASVPSSSNGEGDAEQVPCQNNKKQVGNVLSNLTSGIAKLNVEENPRFVESNASSPNVHCGRTAHQFKDEAPRNKEEVLAERKAKAAEAKARKAAAMAAKKLAKVDKVVHGGEGPEVKGSVGKKQRISDGDRAIVKNHQPTADVEQGSSSTSSGSTSRSSVYQGKTAISNGPSRLSNPLRHVHFDMFRERTEKKTEEHPSQVEAPQHFTHPAFLNFAARCRYGNVIGIDALCVGFIYAFKELLMDYSLDNNRSISHDLDEKTEQQIMYLTENGSYPLPFALQNVVRQLKKEINQLPSDVTEITAKEKIRDWLDDFITQNFDLAFRAISSFCCDKMANTSYIVTYSWCPVVEKIILDALEKGLNFHLCILDSPTVHRGRQLAKTVSARNIECSYGTLNAVGYVMKQCSVVLLGCSAILSNGYVVADRGSSAVALVASAANVPVLVAAQTFKFVDKAQLFDHGHCGKSGLVEEEKEILPADLVTAVVTELRILHPSSAPAVLKAKQLAVG